MRKLTESLSKEILSKRGVIITGNQPETHEINIIVLDKEEKPRITRTKQTIPSNTMCLSNSKMLGNKCYGRLSFLRQTGLNITGSQAYTLKNFGRIMQ